MDVTWRLHGGYMAVQVLEPLRHLRRLHGGYLAVAQAVTRPAATLLSAQAEPFHTAAARPPHLVEAEGALSRLGHVTAM